MKLNSVLHNERTLTTELETVLGFDPGCVLVGSLGRAAIYQKLVGDSMFEYRRRGRPPYQRFNGTAADLDVINAPAIGDNENAFGPFDVDTKSFLGRQVAILRRDGRWILKSANRNFEAEIQPETMAPVESQTVYGVQVSTLPPQTLMALLELHGTMRQQDLHAQAILASAMGESRMNPIPDSYYEPFKELSHLNSESAFTRARNLYRGVVPAAIRRPLAPLLQPIKDHMLR